MKQFKARIESTPTPQSIESMSIHAMEIWFQADNIVAAAEFISDAIIPLGFGDCSVSKLIDVTDQ